jgi:hypothetical protein
MRADRMSCYQIVSTRQSAPGFITGAGYLLIYCEEGKGNGGNDI